MKTGVGWYKWKGRTYHTAHCLNCMVAVTATEHQRLNTTPENTWLKYLNNNIECCGKPDFSFTGLTGFNLNSF